MARRLISPLNRVIAEKFFPTPHYSIKVKQLCNNYSTRYSEVRPGNSSYDTRMHNQTPDHFTSRQNTLPEGQYVDDLMESKRDTSDSLKEPLGRNVSKKDKIKFLVDTLLGLKESKEAVYGALDAWVAWEKTFPLASLRIAMGTLEKEQEWHRVIQA
ncbi:hypothetical protein IFM89_008176 [Coptis chinensis]|uniref:Pentatricopeptide repeat-containing protein n=1 Tax=Coptis chinensis TaxID=261450 RepID=A0A835HYV4_9MAGN|nr:hypothetical protein IFM89_008176 [Coptis chinensis]